MAFKMKSNPFKRSKSALKFIAIPENVKGTLKDVFNPAGMLARKAGFDSNTTIGKILDPMTIVTEREGAPPKKK